jgi:hypothetical protein
MTVFVANLTCCWQENNDKYVMSPHLNEALRKEVLLYTTQGIRYSHLQEVSIFIEC